MTPSGRDEASMILREPRYNRASCRIELNDPETEDVRVSSGLRHVRYLGIGESAALRGLTREP